VPIGIWDTADPGQFQLYFLHLAGLDDAADRAEAAGNTAAAAWRAYEQRLADLTPEEGAILKEVAYGCNQALSDHDASLRAQTTTAEEPLGTRMEIVSAAIDELHAQLGDLSFDRVVQRVKALFANVGTVAAGGPEPTPVTSAIPVGGGLGPPVELDITQPHTDVFSEIVKLDEHTFFAGCGTQPQDDLTLYYYLTPFTVACRMYGIGIGPVNVECGRNGPAYCSTTFSNVPGQSLFVQGLHALRMYWDVCQSEFGDLVDCLRDPLHYGSPPGTPLPDYPDGQRIYAPGGPPVFWLSTYPNDVWLIAGTHSTPVKFLNISPRQVTLYPGAEQHFTSNIPAKWWNFGGKGTLDIDTGVYKAPETITNEDTDTFEACDAQFSPGLVDCLEATVTLKPLKVDVSPDSTEVLPGGQRSFTAIVTPSTAAQPVTWSLVDPTNAATITPLSVPNSLAARFNAPPDNKISATQEITVKACLTPSGSSQSVCGTAKVLVPKLQIFITAPKRTLFTSETVQLTAFVNGSSLPRGVDWSVTPDGLGEQFTPVTPDTLVVSFKAPPFHVNGGVNVKVCLKDAPTLCSDPFHLEIVDRVTILSVTAALNAGELASPFSISGSGFGTHPAVSFEGLQSSILSSSDSLITGVVVVPVASGGGSTRVSVTVTYANGDFESTFFPIGSRIPIAPVSLLAVSPAAAELRAGESRPFSAICLTAQGAACSSPETVRWSATSGAIAPATGMNVTYTAPATVPSNPTATITACWNGSSACGLPAHVTLLAGNGMTVTVSPKTATVQTGHTQAFSAQVGGSTNTNVTWSRQPSTPEAGQIDPTSGVYSAPATLGSVTTVTIIATSQADPTKSDTATVTLTGPPPPLTLTCTPSPASVNPGTAVSWTATASGGGDPATRQYALFRQRAGTTSWIPDVSSPAWQASNVLSWTPLAADVATWGIVIWVRDASTPANMNTYGFAAYCNAGPVKVLAPLSIIVTPSPATANAGNSITWTATATGGDPGTLQYALFRRKAGNTAWTPDVTSPAWQTSNVLSWTPTAADVGTWEIIVWVRDAYTSANMNGYGFAAYANAGPVNVVAPLSLTCTPSPAPVNYGTTISWTATASGGDPATRQYALFRQRAGTAFWIPAVTSPAWQASNVLTWTPSATDVGTWGIVIWVRDGNTPANMNTYGFAAYANAGPVNVVAPLSLACSPSPASATYGNAITWTASASGGTPATTQYAMGRRRTGATAWIPDSTAWQTSNAFSWTPTAADVGTWEIALVVKDGNTPPNANGYGYAAYSNPGQIQVVAPLTVTGTGSPASSTAGTTITWTATASGGSAATIQYAFFRRRAGTVPWTPDVTAPAWQASNVLSWTPAMADIGTWETYVWVRDGNTPPNANGYGFAAGYNPLPVQVTAPVAPLTLTGTGSPASSTAGTTITWTAYASGGTPATIQYAFFRRLAGTPSWIPDVTAPAWQASNVLAWTPSAGDAGTWETYVWVRDGNTPSNANGYGFAAGYNPGPVEITVPLSQAYPAKGWVDGYNTQHIWGWACDPDYPTESNRVDFWSTTGQPLGSTGAFIDSSAAIAAQCLGGYAHYFDFYPSGGLPSGTHFNAWSIDLPYATPGNANRRCGGNGAIGDGTEFVIP
jgi:hypothetical protein